MATLEELLAQLQLTPQDRRQAQTMGLLAAGLGILGAPGGRRNPGAAIGQGGLLGLNAYQQTLGDAQQGKLGQLKGMELAQSIADRERARREEEQYRAALSGFQLPPPLPNMAPTPENAKALEARPPPGEYERVTALAKYLESKGLPKQAEQYYARAEKLAPKYKGTEVVMQDGKPVLLQQYENRPPEPLRGYAPKPDFAEVDLGGTKQFVDRYQLPPTGQTFVKTMTPEGADTSKRGWAGLGLEREKFGYQKQRDVTQDAARAAGELKPATEAQSNAVMFGIRAIDTDKTLRDLEKSYNPTGWKSAKDIAAAGNIATNWMASDIGQQYINSGKNFVAATLRKESGAQISESEWKQGTQLYIPMPGDSDKVLEQKRRNRELVIQGLKAAAGPHSAQIAPTPRQSTGATGGWEIREVK